MQGGLTRGALLFCCASRLRSRGGDAGGAAPGGSAALVDRFEEPGGGLVLAVLAYAIASESNRVVFGDDNELHRPPRAAAKACQLLG